MSVFCACGRFCRSCCAELGGRRSGWRRCVILRSIVSAVSAAGMASVAQAGQAENRLVDDPGEALQLSDRRGGAKGRFDPRRRSAAATYFDVVTDETGSRGIDLPQVFRTSSCLLPNRWAEGNGALGPERL